MDDGWSLVDDFISAELLPDDPDLEAALASMEAAGLPPHAVTPHQGRLLHILARMAGARRILEIGTLGGYSTIQLARALGEGGRLITLEANPVHADIALENIERAGLSDKVDLRLGLAEDTLAGMDPGAPFDLIFIDADKKSTPAYFKAALRLSRSGTVIIIDNVVRGGEIAGNGKPGRQARGLRRFFKDAGGNAGLTATAIQTVGAKGWDGFAIALVD